MAEQNNDETLNNSSQERLPPSKFEIDFNKGMFNPQELLEKEEQDRLNYEEKIILNQRRAVATQCKTIALDMKNLDPLTNTNTLTKEEYVALWVEMNNIRLTWTAEDIEKKFNEICNRTIFAQNKSYWYYPVYDV